MRDLRAVARSLKGAGTSEQAMKEGIHPKYHPVIFVDASTNDEIVSRSTMSSNEKRSINGVEHFVISMDITAYSHPFFTGKQTLMDTEGRSDRFRTKYG